MKNDQDPAPNVSPTHTSAQFRVFVAATFPDMYDERELIMNKVLPELRRRSIDHGVRNTSIDVRWTTNERENIESTADAIMMHRPVLVGLIGERPGWIPPVRDFEPDEVAERCPWLADIASRQSVEPVVDLLNRIIDDPLMRGRIFFYRRRHSADPKLLPPARAILLELERRVADMQFPIRDYDDAESLAEAVRIDLVAALRRFHPGNDSTSLLERERWFHQARERELLTDYIVRGIPFAKLDSHAISDTQQGLVIVGPAGSGKSALIANWSATYHERITDDPNTIVLTHYVGASSGGLGAAALIQRVMAEINDLFGIDADLPTTREEIIERFQEWLNHVQGKRLVLAIDALDQLEDEDRDLTWLPQHIQPNVRLILSVLDERNKDGTAPARSPLAVLLERKWRLLEVTPLGIQERRELIERILARSGTHLTVAERDRLAKQPMSGHALSLRIGLAQLRAHGSHEELNQLISRYLSAPSPEEVIVHALKDLERDYSVDLVREVLMLISASRRGLNESELSELIGTDKGDVSRLLVALSRLLMRRQGLLGFFHPHIRRAALELYKLTGAESEGLHRRIARYFRQQPISPRRAEEEPWQWRQANAKRELKGCIASIPMFLELQSLDKWHELLEHWLWLGRRHSMVESYEAELARFADSSRSSPPSTDIYLALGTFLHRAARYGAALDMYERAEAIVRTHRQGQPMALADIFKHKGESLLALSQFQDASSTYLESISILSSTPNNTRRDLAEVYERLGSLYYTWKRFDEAEEYLRLSIEAYSALPDCNHYTTLQPHSILLAIAIDRHADDRAEKIATRLLPLYEAKYGPDHPETGTMLNNLGTVYGRKERFEAALTYVSRAIAIDERSYGKSHPETAKKLVNRALYLKKLRRREEAESEYRRAMKLLEATQGPIQHEVADCANNLGALYRSMKRYDEAETYYRKAYTIRKKLFGSNHLRTVNTELNIAGNRAAKGKSSKSLRVRKEAARLYHAAILKKIEVSGFDDEETQRAIANYHALLKDLGWTDEDLPFVVNPMDQNDDA